MFTLVRRFIKTGIVFLFAGVLLGFYNIVRRELFGIFPEPHLTSAHVHAVAIGFVGYLILGVALWLFPRASKDDTRYSPQRIEASYWIMTLATSLRFVTEIGRATSTSGILAWAIVISSLGQIAALALYFWTMWGRIRPVGSQIREAAGERF